MVHEEDRIIQLFTLLNKYSSDCEYVEDFDIIKIYIKDLKTNLNIFKKIIKILVFEAQYKRIKRNKIILEVLGKDILSEEILVLLNIMKLTKTLHYFKIKIKGNIVANELELLSKNYSGLNIK